jgi:hypothetical protein
MGGLEGAQSMYGQGLDAEMLAAQGMYGQFDPETGQFTPGQMYGAFQDYSGDLMDQYGQRQTGLMNLQSVLGGNLMGLQARQGENLMGMQQAGMGGLMGAYGEARSEIGGMAGGQNQGLNLQYGQRLSTVMGMLDELGGQERRDIESSWDDQSSQAQMDLASRGLSNTTVLSTMEAGYEERKRDDLGRLDERLRREKTTAYEGLSADMLMSQERGYLRALEVEMGLRTGELGAMERGYGQQLGLAGGLADQRLGLSQGISNQQLGMQQQLSGEQLGMYGALGQQGLGYMEQGMGGMLGMMEQDRLSRYGLTQDTMGYDIGLTQNMMNFEAGIQHMPPSMYPWQVAQQTIGGIGQTYGSMQQVNAMQDQARAQERAGMFNMFGNLGSATIGAAGNVWGAQIGADAMRDVYGYGGGRGGGYGGYGY